MSRVEALIIVFPFSLPLIIMTSFNDHYMCLCIYVCFDWSSEQDKQFIEKKHSLVNYCYQFIQCSVT